MGHTDQGLRTGRRRYRAVPRVLVFLRNSNDVLLLRGAPNKRIWASQYNGVGGHMEIDEDVITAARREVREETGLEVSDLILEAVVNIDAGEVDLGIVMFVFVGWSERRQTVASSEGELRWVPVDQLAAYNLVEDLAWLLPRILNSRAKGQPLYLHYSYSDSDELVIRQA